jgi:hypothetical protein
MSGGRRKNQSIRLLADLAATPPTDPEHAPGAGIVYGLVHGQREASVLRLIRPDGKPLTLPYSLMPIVWGDFLPAIILVEYAGFFTLRLRGHDLDPLELFISERRVTWVRACDPATAAALPLAVTGIDLLRYYPSREFAGDPRAAAIIEQPEPAEP